MKKYSMLFLFLLILGSCGKTLRTTAVDSIDSIPEKKYEAYVYSSGEGEKLRAVFLKDPEAHIEIVPYSLEMSETKGTLEEALEFMGMSSGYKKVNIEKVLFQGREIGYLLTHKFHSFKRAYIEAQLYERNGKIYFTIWESPLSTDD